MIQIRNTAGITVGVGADGSIYLGTHRLNQKDAIDIAIDMVNAVRLSQDRNQIGTPGYYHSERIIERMQSPLGKSLTALKKVF